jgi:hypothetical protein
MYVTIPSDGYWLDHKQIKKIEEIKSAKYMGYWCTKSPYGVWNNSPVDVFYVSDPDLSKGHSHYFGLFYQNDVLYITDASSAFCEDIVGMPTPSGEVIVSRYRHDHVAKDEFMIDGGRDYFRGSLHPTVTVTVEHDRFVINNRDESAVND